jgi:hypothetical protein
MISGARTRNCVVDQRQIIPDHETYRLVGFTSN